MASWHSVSAVPPDLEIASTPVLAGFSRPAMAWKVSGSTLSRKRTSGAPGGGPKPRWASAATAFPPSEEPPVPSTSTVSKPLAK